jgi:hypothetical protein
MRVLDHRLHALGKLIDQQKEKERERERRKEEKHSSPRDKKKEMKNRMKIGREAFLPCPPAQSLPLQ